MERKNILAELDERLSARFWGYSRIMVLYDNDFKGIVRLKKTLRQKTKEYDDFYKREHGFYNQSLEIFICNNKTNDMSTSGAYCIFVTNEEEAEEAADAIIKVVENFYDRQPYYTVTFASGEGNYLINEHSFNKYELHKEWNRMRDKPCIKDIFDSKLEAQRAAYRYISSLISEKQKAINLLKEKQQELEEKIQKELKK